MSPGVQEELALLANGHRLIAGIDEAGRGCWAGPVVAAAVILPAAILENPALLPGVDDSKALSATQRENAYTRICAVADWRAASIPASIIDTHGILRATRMAMWAALLGLRQLPDALLIDAVELHGWQATQRSLIKGDARALSIAAASIIAKVTRDRLMSAWAGRAPDYGFAQHKGYGTAAHAAALSHHGPSPQHRHSFRPIWMHQFTPGQPKDESGHQP